MQLQRIWRVILTGAILVGLWWWTTVSAGADGAQYRHTAPLNPVPAGVHSPHFGACNPASWRAFLPAELNRCVLEANQHDSLSAPVRAGLVPR